MFILSMSLVEVVGEVPQAGEPLSFGIRDPKVSPRLLVAD
jgi:hypothetical protein